MTTNNNKISRTGISGKIRIAFAVFVLVMIVGTTGFRLLEDNFKNLLDSFFFTLITVTTVGYGNIVPQTTPGKVLAIAIILAGVGSAMAALHGLFEMLVGRKIREALNLPEKETQRKDHYIICGYSMVGMAIVRNLQEIGEDFVVIENSERQVARLVENKVPVIQGDARDESVLERAAIGQAKCLLAALDDATNVFITLTAKLLNPKIHVVSKAQDTTNVVKMRKAGADEVVACHAVGAQMMVKKALSTKNVGGNPIETKET